MAKKDKIEESFLTSNVFLFDSYACNCKIETVYENPGVEPTETVAITVDKSKPVRFAFGSKIGLVRLNEDGSIAESNILGKLLAIDSSDVKNYFGFFALNGFLLPASETAEDHIKTSDLQLIVDRLHATLVLMSTITDMSRTSYEKIVRMIFYHLFAPIVTVEVNNSRYKYISSNHSYSKFLTENKDSKRDERFNDTFNNSEFMFTDSVSSFSIDADFLSTILDGTINDGYYDSTLFKNVTTAYCSPRQGKPRNMLLMNDFVFHYLYDVGIIEHVDLEKTYYVGGKVNKDNFSPKMKEKATELAKFIIKEEIESNLKRVRPTYNMKTLEPAWKIDSLLSALYFGLFYMRPNMETYRRCANPKCNEFFLVPVSSRNKRFCCKACQNREMAARKRARDRMLKSANE